MTRAQNGQRDPLERPWVRRALQEDLAKSGKTQAELARKYGVSGAAITKFKQRHAPTIQAIVDNAADEFAGILLAKKVSRIEALAQQVEDLEQSTDPKDRRLYQAALRGIAEELGHLPGRVTLSGDVNTTTKYVIDGMDPEDLK